jgi:hypothetical protein
MRDLEMEELTHVYGAGGRGRSPCPPSKPPRCGRGGKSGSRGRGSGSGRGKRCGRGGSS